MKDKELLNYTSNINSLPTLRRYLKELTDLDYITMVSKKPIIRTVSNKVKEILY